MKIAVDISQVVYETGVSTYTRNLFREILKTDLINQYFFFGGTFRRRSDFDNFFSSLSGNFTKKVYPISPYIADLIWNKLHVLNIENITGPVDLFHSSDWSQPPSKAVKITTIHDLVPLRFPKLSHPNVISAHKDRLKWVKKEVNAIIVPTKDVEEDAIGLGIDERKIYVIPEAVGPEIEKATSEEVEAIKRKYRISGKYLLAVGVNPRKNTERIVEAYTVLKAKRKNLKLVVIGHPYAKLEGIRGVIFTGHVSTDEISAFYTGSEALVYPSIYEGFGLPILEAFVSETPVVTSNVSGLPEITGNAAVLVDPYEVGSIIEGIETVLGNRGIWIRKGQSRVKNYSWNKTALETIQVYNKAYEQSR